MPTEWWISSPAFHPGIFRGITASSRICKQ